MDSEAPQDLIQMLKTEQRVLDFERVQVVAGMSLPSGAFNPELTARLDEVVKGLILTLRADLLTDEAGPVTVKQTRWQEFTPPGWMPKWLIHFIVKRWTKTMVHEVEVEPKFIFPEANFYPDSLGRQFRFLKVGNHLYSEDRPESEAEQP